MKKTFSLKNTFLFSILLLVVFLQIISFMFNYFHMQAMLLQQYKTEAQNTAFQMNDHVLQKIKTMHTADEKSSFAQFYIELRGKILFAEWVNSIRSLQAVQYVDNSGKTRVSTNGEGFSFPEILTADKKIITAWRADKKIAVAVPVSDESLVYGNIIFLYDDSILEQQRSDLLRTYLYIFLLSIGLGVFGAWCISNIISKPVKNLVNDCKTIAEGHFEHEIQKSSIDELRVVADSFSNMRDAVVEKIADLSQKNEELKNVMNDRLKAEEQLRQSQKMESIGQLAGGIAHDFNNMLNAILGSVHILKMSITDRDLLEDIEIIKEAAGNAANLTQKLLLFSRKAEKRVELIELHMVIEDVVSFMGRSIDKKIQLVKMLNAGICTVKGDKNQLQNLFLNLGLNARDAVIGTGKIGFESENIMFSENSCPGGLKPGNYIKITVFDTGRGIENEILHRIFEPFFTTKDVGKGTGLGLTMAYGIVNDHGGSITVESKPGEGTQFYVYLPVAEREGEDTKSADSTVSGSGYIMIIDDEAMNARMTKRLLDSVGYESILFTDSEQAVDAYKKLCDKIDVVVLDMVMPKLNGQEVYEQMKQINPDVRVVFVSGFSQNYDHRILRGKNVAFIQKPFDIPAFSKTIADLSKK